MKSFSHCELISEKNLLVRFGDHISEDLLDVIEQASLCAAKVFGRQLHDIVASYTTLLIEFDPLLISPWQAKINFQKAWEKHCLTMYTHPANSGENYKTDEKKCIEIPVYYHPSVGWDIQVIAEDKGLSWQQVVQYHSQKEYRVYALGFAPGFAFMGQLDPCLETTRKAKPRVRVPAGSVAISDLQTAVYPNQSPGGWNIIGRSPSSLFNAEGSPSTLLKTADRVKFIPIDKAKFLHLGGSLNDLNSTDNKGEA